MSERLAPTEASEAPGEIEDTEDIAWITGERYAQMKVNVGEIGDNFYYSLPTFTILVETEEELGPLNDEFSTLFSKYTDQIIVGDPHVATLILAINQAAVDLDAANGAIAFLREKVKESTGSYEAAGEWQVEK